MTEWRITQKRSFLTDLLKLPPKEEKQILQKLEMLSQDPTPDAKVKKQLKHMGGKLHSLRSGDYRIFYIDGGKRLSHTIDPRTGRPVEGGPASATVIAETATEADAWATTMMVLGEKEGLALADQRGIAVFLLFRDESGAIVERHNGLWHF